MSARALTGAALAAALRKATTPAISGALARNAERVLAAVVDAEEGRDLAGGAPSRLSPPLWGRVGEGGTTSVSPARTPYIGAGTPHPDPLPQGERETALISAASRVSGSLSLDVILSGEDLFVREFGALDAVAEPVLAPAIERLRRRAR
jgi:hypothetical protein